MNFELCGPPKLSQRAMAVDEWGCLSGLSVDGFQDLAWLFWFVLTWKQCNQLNILPAGLGGSTQNEKKIYKIGIGGLPCRRYQGITQNSIQLWRRKFQMSANSCSVLLAKGVDKNCVEENKVEELNFFFKCWLSALGRIFAVKTLRQKCVFLVVFEGVQSKHFWFCSKTNGHFQWKSCVGLSSMAVKVRQLNNAVTTVHFYFQILTTATVHLSKMVPWGLGF